LQHVKVQNHSLETFGADASRYCTCLVGQSSMGCRKPWRPEDRDIPYPHFQRPPGVPSDLPHGYRDPDAIQLEASSLISLARARRGIQYRLLHSHVSHAYYSKPSHVLCQKKEIIFTFQVYRGQGKPSETIFSQPSTAPMPQKHLYEIPPLLRKTHYYALPRHPTTHCRTRNPYDHEGAEKKRKTCLYVANGAHEGEFCATRVMVEPEFARTLPPMAAPVRGDTVLPADPGRWPPLLLRGREERRADEDA
jgi:hypothetical protein